MTNLAIFYAFQILGFFGLLGFLGLSWAPLGSLQSPKRIRFWRILGFDFFSLEAWRYQPNFWAWRPWHQIIVKTFGLQREVVWASLYQWKTLALAFWARSPKIFAQIHVIWRVFEFLGSVGAPKDAVKVAPNMDIDDDARPLLTNYTNHKRLRILCHWYEICVAAELKPLGSRFNCY